MISTAIQKGNAVYVYNERNGIVFIKNGELAGYTSSTVSIKQNHSIITYRENGSILSNRSC